MPAAPPRGVSPRAVLFRPQAQCGLAGGRAAMNEMQLSPAFSAKGQGAVVILPLFR